MASSFHANSLFLNLHIRFARNHVTYDVPNPVFKVSTLQVENQAFRSNLADFSTEIKQIYRQVTSWLTYILIENEGIASLNRSKNSSYNATVQPIWSV